jgi:hypothetical protein
VDLSRTPPEEIRRALRQEVGFGCPVPGCASPYLEYHHFDPTWAEEHHHRPEGMIPLCAEHHAKASAWTSAQLRQMKTVAAENRSQLTGRFEWMRKDCIALIGGNFYYDTPNMVVVRGQPAVWYERDSDGHLLLNLKMLTASGEPRAELRNNDWIAFGSPKDVVSPTKGHRLRITYANGDDLRVLFWEAESLESMARRYKVDPTRGLADMPFPLLVTEVQMTVAGAGIKFGPTKTSIGGATITGFGVFKSCGAGLSID